MNRGKLWFVFMLAVLFLLQHGSQSFAGDSTYSRATLRGLRGVYVKVDRLASEVVREGLTEQHIVEEVKQKLDSAGIGILSDTEGLRQFGNPYLHIKPRITKTKTGLYLCFITVEFVQDARLVRNRSLLRPVATWSVGVEGTIYKNLSEKVGNHIKDLMDRFIDAYLSVNPR